MQTEKVNQNTFSQIVGWLHGDESLGMESVKNDRKKQSKVIYNPPEN